MRQHALPFFLSSPSKAAIYLKFLTISVEYFEGGRARGPEGETNSLQNAMQHEEEEDDLRSRRHPQSSVSKGECGSTGEGERKRMFFGENSVRAKGLWAGLTKRLRTS